MLYVEAEKAAKKKLNNYYIWDKNRLMQFLSFCISLLN